MTILKDLSKEQLIAMLEAKSAPKALTCKVSEKGALSIYGLGRFPITLYLSQWQRLYKEMNTIAKFVDANMSQFKTKDAA